MRRVVLAAAALMLFTVIPWRGAGQGGTAKNPITINPRRVQIDVLYSGATIEVRAEVPAGYQAAVRLMTRPGRLELKRLGRKVGVLWMGVGNISFDRVPAVYQVLTSVPLNELGPQSLRAQWMIGYDSLLPDQIPAAAMRSELVGLKEHDGLFALREGALERGGAGAQIEGPMLAELTETDRPVAAVVQPPELWRGTLRLPACAPAGDYSVDLIGFKEQHAVMLGSTTLHLEYAGIIRAFRNLAIEHGFLYGIAACSIAMIAGLLTGLIFRAKSNEGH